MTSGAEKWVFNDDSKCVLDDGEITRLLDNQGDTIIDIGTGGYACESDPYGSYPILEISSEHRALIQSAPVLLEACRAAYRQISGDYSDGGEYRDDRTVLDMLVDAMGGQANVNRQINEVEK